MDDLIDKLRGIEISVVRANRALLGTTPVTSANELVSAAAARLEAQEALLKEAMAWLADFADAKFDAVQTHRTSHPADEPDPVTDAETVWAYQDDARPTLAKLRAHLDGRADEGGVPNGI